MDIDNLKKDEFIEIQIYTDKDKCFIGLIQQINKLVIGKFLIPNRKKEYCIFFHAAKNIDSKDQPNQAKGRI